MVSGGRKGQFFFRLWPLVGNLVGPTRQWMDGLISMSTGAVQTGLGVLFFKKAQSQNRGGVDLKEVELSTLKIQCMKFLDD